MQPLKNHFYKNHIFTNNCTRDSCILTTKLQIRNGNSSFESLTNFFKKPSLVFNMLDLEMSLISQSSWVFKRKGLCFL